MRASHKHFIILLLHLALVCSKLGAQQGMILNQSNYNYYLLNPAALSTSDEMDISLYYKKNWVNMFGSPTLSRLTIGAPLYKSNYGLGLNLANECAGIFSTINLSGAIRYKLKVAPKKLVFMGIQAGIQRQEINFSRIIASSPEEFQNYSQMQTSTIPNASFGIYYSGPHIQLGLSANNVLKQKHLYANSTNSNRINSSVLPLYIFNIKKNIVFRDVNLNFIPEVTCRTIQGLPIIADALVTFVYNRKLMLGIGYRSNSTLFANFGIIVSEKLRIVYSFDYTSNIQRYTGSGQEIGISYSWGKEKRSLSKSKIDTLNIDLSSMNRDFESQRSHQSDPPVINESQSK